MKGIIFAAGLGTRLRPITDTVPKALIDINGKTMLERALIKLSDAGVDDFVINTHHFHEKIETYLRDNNYFGLKITLSHEVEYPLETGGGLKFARCYLDGNEPFFVYNADIISSVNLKAVYAYHKNHNALATLVVRQRPTQRHLMFDEKMLLKGREAAHYAQKNYRLFGFSGIHVLSPDIFNYMFDEKVFSLTDLYVKLCGQNKKILGFEDESDFWFDIGSIEKLNLARQYTDLEKGLLNEDI